MLINPPQDNSLYFNDKVRVKSNNYAMPLGLCCVAAVILQQTSDDVQIFDMNVGDDPEPKRAKVCTRLWDVVGITSMTPFANQTYAVLDRLKHWEAEFTVGGAHATGCPNEIRARTVTVGTNVEVSTGEFEDGYNTLDDLPIPAYHLLYAPNYIQSPFVARRSPVGMIETSRGCFGRCTFCTKGKDNKMRYKSAERVVKEMETLLDLGYREIHIVDDNFTGDVQRVYDICRIIKERGLKFPWYPRNGIRVDNVSFELLKTMKGAGCYRVLFGIESGSQRVLDRVGKRITLKQAENAVWLAKRSGLETQSFFMVGFTSETEDDLKATCDFIRKINADLVRVNILIPLPGSQVFKEWDKKGYIKSKDWSLYNPGQDLSTVYDHPTLDWDTIHKYMRKYYIAAYFGFRRILPTFRILKGLIPAVLWFYGYKISRWKIWMRIRTL
jgi:radical SAM superfamily enzyme YgiQ (UPF0313 family)